MHDAPREAHGFLGQPGEVAPNIATVGSPSSSSVQLTTNNQQRTTTSSRAAFTLVELLVVITIISMLAALASVAVMGALEKAKQTKIKTEVNGLDLALKAYKEKYGDYPPCDLRMSNAAAVRAHVARAFPRYNGSGGISNVMADIAMVVEANGNNFRPDQALVFWLGGFNPDVSRPFENLNNLSKAQRTPAFFDFDQTRLRPLPSTPMPPVTGLSYIQIGSKTPVPYVYFDGAGAKNAFNLWQMGVSGALPYQLSGVLFGQQCGTAQPYIHDINGDGNPTNEQYANADGVQVIAAGLDGIWGNPMAMATLHRLYPTGTNYDLATQADDDNVTNFCDRSSLGDAKP